jgi:hypothetical protein
MSSETDIFAARVGKAFTRHDSALCVQKQLRSTDIAPGTQPHLQIAGSRFPQG